MTELVQLWSTLSAYGPWAVIAGVLGFSLYRLVRFIVFDCFSERRQLRDKLDTLQRERWQEARATYRESERERAPQ
jgi:hypothetical protein